jgi:hypothetical protein
MTIMTTAVTYPEITLRETYCTTFATLKNALKIKKLPVSTRSVGRKMGIFSVDIPNVVNEFTRSIAVTLVGPKLRKWEPANKAAAKVATVAPYSPYSMGKPASKAYAIA